MRRSVQTGKYNMPGDASIASLRGIFFLFLPAYLKQEHGGLHTLWTGLWEKPGYLG